MKTLPAAAALWAGLACASASGCLLAAGTAAAAPPGEPVLLWSKVAPGSEGKTGPEKVDTRDGVRRVSSIHRPSLTPHLPAKGTGNGAAVIILPGGGHRYLAIDNEGHPVASWLSDHGIAAFVLKYRLAREEGSNYKVEQHALWDAQRALRIVRSRAKQWGIDPARVGLLGFSAGGQVTSYAAARFDAGKPGAADAIERESSRPAFQGLMYAGAAPADVVIPKDAPPAFLLTAADDKNPTQNAVGTFQKLREAGIEAELHVFARGGHGFGLKPRPLNVTHWPDRFQQWLDEQGFLKPLPPAPVPPKAATPAERELDQRFAATVKPFLDRYCTDCHGGDKPKADLDLRPYANLNSVIQDFPRWAQLAEKLESKEMPPKKSDQPPAASQHQVIEWIAAVRSNQARKHAGDPGTVLARRLSNAEYNNSIRDLTGVDIRPTREFPVDPANTAGFDNSGESLAMSPALLKKYLDAAREVANHLVLESEGVAFAPHPMLVETDRDKYCVQKIVDFYKQQNSDLAAYFQAAWRFRHRAALGQPRATLASLAAERQVSARYLTTIWRALEQERHTVGPMARLQAMWRELPAPRRQPRAIDADALVKPGATAMRDYVVKLRKKLEPRFTGPAVAGLQATSQPLAMWRNRQYASHRMTCDREALQLDGKPLLAQATTAKKPADEDAENDEEEAPTGREERKAGPDPDLAVPAAQQARTSTLASFDRFCAVFPDTFYVAERGRNYQDKTRDRGRLLSAGFHNLMGYFRDDQPLYQLLLEPAQQKQLDRLWRELDFVADATRRTYLQFYFSGAATTVRRQKGAPDAARPADGQVTTQPAIEELQKAFLERIAPAKSQQGNLAIREHFGWVNTTLRWTETAHTAAEPKHLQALLDFAGRAYRRPLTDAERDSLLAYYKKLRTPTGQNEPGLGHEEAMRDLLVSVLMSPDFCYRIDLVAPGGARPLSDHALASRLSYFLWSSTPDAQLLAHARAGDLHKPKVLAAQARRMLKDPKARGLATEFGGSWLDFRRFEEHNAVDRQRFASFTNELRSAMFEEPVQFLLDVFRNDRSVLDLLYADHTFVNPVLAKHYGITIDKDAGAGDWVRVPDAGRHGRGGLLPMAVFLTKNAPGLRTSPVKRGYWVVRNVLGERIPPPPAVVPELPRDEAKLDLPLRELLAKHREDAACSGCHARFDSLGLVFEGYGPIGEQRTQDLAGRPVDPKASFPGGVEGTGLAGLRAYLRSKRQDDFVDNLSRKLLAFGLGRTLVLSDEPAVAQMKARLAKDWFRFDTLVESVVLSPQFLTKRGRDAVAAR